jgi:GNAT superfamily N-acetyltransferase
VHRTSIRAWEKEAVDLGGVRVVQAVEKKQWREFLELPYRLYRGDPYWVPPLRIAVKDLLNTEKHPFYANAEMACFLAQEDGHTVGRIAAILDNNFNKFHRENLGFFGFLEMIDSQPVADALLRQVRQWLEEKRVRAIQGPMNPSTNYECGILVEGFDSSPYVMMTYNPPYYAARMEQAGWRKAKDLYAYLSGPAVVDADRVMRVAGRALRQRGVRIRQIDMKRFGEEVDTVWNVYNSAWSRNWGFVPMTKDEFFALAKDMKQILVPEFVLIGEVGDRAVGFALGLPDINQALKRAGGNLFPFGLLKILYYQRLIKDFRVVALGVVEEFRTAGVAAGFYSALIEASRRLGYRDCEMSWILEDNVLMNRSMEAIGAKRYKTYRIYEWN